MSLPTWSVMIPTYNSAQYLAETLESVLDQNFSIEKMEIVVVDNCSTDNTKAIVEQVGKGRVTWFQNPTNIGMMNNFNKCIEKANGSLIHILNSDDVVNLGYYVAMEKAFIKNSEVYLVSCDAQIIDEHSAVSSVTDSIDSLQEPSSEVADLVLYNKFRTPAVTVRKKAYEIVGGFDSTLIQTADWDMWLRIINQFKGLHLSEPLCKYRVHSDNGSSRVMLTGENITDTERIYKKFEQLRYPVDKKLQLKFLSSIARNQYLEYYHAGNKVGMKNLMIIYKRIAGNLPAIRLGILQFLMSYKRVLKTLLSS